jgi:hypothetical protein
MAIVLCQQHNVKGAAASSGPMPHSPGRMAALYLFRTLGAAAKPDDAPKTAIEGYFLGLSKRSIEAA